jgi:tetraacyldisaccharide 4'-kinase
VSAAGRARSLVLAPLGAVFGAGAALRVGLYGRGILRRSRLSGPVISVGNLSVGGSGKTPLVARIAEILRDAGEPVAVLSRGYGGSFRGDYLIVGDGAAVLADSAEAGDEPVMLARALPGVVVAVGPRRDRVGRAVEARFGRRVHVLDDGFQHLRLARDLDVLSVCEADLRDRPLPAGRLRERASASARADLLCLWSEAALLPPHGDGRTFHVRRVPLGFFDTSGEARPAPARPFLLSGIANPERFWSDMAAAAPGVVGRTAYADHHRFTPNEVRGVYDSARAVRADAIVTTAKDAVRLPPVAPELPVLVFRIAAQIDDEPRFRERLLAAARRAA